MTFVRIWFLCSLAWLLNTGLLAQTKPPLEQAARTILETHCLACHGASRMSGLDVRQRDSILSGGTRGPALVPGRAADSLLYQAVTGTGDLKMPPGKAGLSDGEKEVLRAWIDSGALWAQQPTTKTGEPSWWAFRKLVRPPVPEVGEKAWKGNAIDAFILQTLQAKEMKPALPASRVTLVRRVYFDLWGLPPSPEQVRRFVDDRSPDAYAKLIDELLSSPRYGERWGRHWLDVVRYADTGGFETDIYYPNAWRYRDYVIKSLNEDKPYDRFVQEQIAGDEIWPDTLELEGSYFIPKQKLEHLEARVATGLYTLGPVLHESGLDGEFLRSERLADMADTTGAVFLGLTMGCARCHDHKFDPIPQRDYYRLQTIFAGSVEREIPLVDVMRIFDYQQALPKLLAVEDLRSAVERIRLGARKRIIERIEASLPPEVVKASRTPAAKRTPKEVDLAGEYETAIGAVKEETIEKEYSPEEKQERQRLIWKIGRAYLDAPRRVPTASVLSHSEIVPEVHVAKRGDFKNPGERVNAGFPSILCDGRDIAEATSRPFVPQRRKQLALWLTQPDHPLTARIMVNRLWQGHFGRGIVSTPNDFGRQGDPPSHPELLDWLAVEFVDRGWSLKAMHRLIMLSNTYQMSNQFDAKNASVDPDNRFLWRMNRQRLEAEALRDAVLAVSGKLNLKMGGPPVVPPLTKEELAGLKEVSQWPVSLDPSEHVRRGVYLYVKRSFRLPMFEIFDQPESSFSCSRRDVTNVAPQALALLNNEFTLQNAEELAIRLLKEFGSSPEAWIQNGWNLALGRSPSGLEKGKAMEHFSKTQPVSLSHTAEGNSGETFAPKALVEFCLMLFNLNEFIYVD